MVRHIRGCPKRRKGFLAGMWLAALWQSDGQRWSFHLLGFRSAALQGQTTLVSSRNHRQALLHARPSAPTMNLTVDHDILEIYSCRLRGIEVEEAKTAPQAWRLRDSAATS